MKHPGLINFSKVDQPNNFKWLDENHNWYTYYSARNRLLNIVLKTPYKTKFV